MPPAPFQKLIGPILNSRARQRHFLGIRPILPEPKPSTRAHSHPIFGYTTAASSARRDHFRRSFPWMFRTAEHLPPARLLTFTGGLDSLRRLLPGAHHFEHRWTSQSKPSLSFREPTASHSTAQQFSHFPNSHQLDSHSPRPKQAMDKTRLMVHLSRRPDPPTSV
jgi:hypothetical protein